MLVLLYTTIFNLKINFKSKIEKYRCKNIEIISLKKTFFKSIYLKVIIKCLKLILNIKKYSLNLLKFLIKCLFQERVWQFGKLLKVMLSKFGNRVVN